MTETIYEPIMPINIDSTMRSCFVSCPQKFYLEFVLGLRPTELSIHLHAGACFANAIERMGIATHVENHDFQKALNLTLAGFFQDWGDVEAPERGSGSNKTKDRVWEAIEDYFFKYPPLTDHVQPHFITGKPSYEFTFAIPLEPALNFGEVPALSEIERYRRGDGTIPKGFPRHPSGDPYYYCGRVDRLGEWGTKTVIQDEKTTGSIGSSWAEQWDLRAQFMGYIWAMQQHGINVDTVVVRGVGILKTKITQVEAFRTFAKWEIERWYEQLRRDIWRMHRCWEETYFDYNLAESCSSYGGCSFQKLCTSNNPENWYSHYAVKRWNPLYKNPTEEKKLVAA